MAALKCDICGGKLVGKPGGLIECEYCGVEYSTEWAKEKIQEIKGTVKIEGTVEVQGTVKIDGPVKIEGGISIENLLKRGQMALLDEDWDKAEECFEEALKIDAECAKCYLGILCARYQCADADSLLSAEYSRLRNDKDFARVAKYADEELRKQIAALEKEHTAQNAVRPVKSGESILGQNPFLARILPAQNLVCCTDKLVVAVKTDGTLLTLKHDRLDRFETQWYQTLCEELAGWHDIVAVSAGHHTVVGLKSDGTVVAASVLSDISEIAVSEWTDIVAIDAGSKRTLGLKSDGTVVAAGKEYSPDPLTMVTRQNLSGWKNMAVAGHLYLTDYGIRKDGSIVLGDWIDKDSDEVKSIRRWKNIVSLAACSGGTGSMAHYFVGLRPDGTIALPDGGCVGENIAALHTGGYGAYALDKNGNVYTIRLNGTLENYLMGQNVVAITTQEQDLICLRSDGTLIRRTWRNISNDFVGWKLFENVDTIEQERKQCAEEKARRIEEEKAAAYETGVEILSGSRSEDDLLYAMQLFEKLGNYRDSKDKVNRTRIRLGEVKKDATYATACALLKKNVPDEIHAAQRLFRNLGKWRDCAEMVTRCDEKLEKLNRIEMLSKEKQSLVHEREGLGIFSGKRKKEIAAEIERIDAELAQLKKELE